MHLPAAAMHLGRGSAQSPEKLQRKLEELRTAAEKERHLTTDAEKRMRDVQARLDAVARVHIQPLHELAASQACLSLSCTVCKEWHACHRVIGGGMLRWH